MSYLDSIERRFRRHSPQNPANAGRIGAAWRLKSLSFVPGYNSVKFLADLAGVEFKPFEAITSNEPAVSVDPKILLTGRTFGHV